MKYWQRNLDGFYKQKRMNDSSKGVFVFDLLSQINKTQRRLQPTLLKIKKYKKSTSITTEGVLKIVKKTTKYLRNERNLRNSCFKNMRTMI